MTPPPERLAATPPHAAHPPAQATAIAADQAAPALGFAVGRARLLQALALLPALLFLLVVLAPPLNHDVAAVLNFAERWLAGERLYRDLIDVNPPLIFVLSLVPAALAAVTPLDGPQALLACMLALCAGIWRLCGRLREGRAEGPIEAATLAALLPLALLLAGYDFAQREHLMAIAALPYVFLCARRAEGLPTPPRLAIPTALIAALGFALKPHFLAVPALLEAGILWHLLRQGSRPSRALVALLRDPAPWLMAAVWLAYLASLPLLFPDYVGHVLPLVWDFYLDNGNLSLWSVLLSDKMGTVLLLLLVLVPLAWHRAAGPVAKLLALAALGGFISAWVQHKGWTYHVVPMLTFGGLLAGLLAARFADRLLPEARARGAAPLVAALAAAGLALFVVRGGEAPWREIRFHADKAGRLTAWLKQEAFRERLLVLTADIYPIYPALNYAEARSTLRTMNLWLLQGTNRQCLPNGQRYRETWEMSRAEFFVYRTVAEDFARAPPAAVLITRHPGIPWCGSEFDFIEYFSRHPAFAATFERYRQVGEIEGYKLYVRAD
jgi:hypothetical protein